MVHAPKLISQTLTNIVHKPNRNSLVMCGISVEKKSTDV